MLVGERDCFTMSHVRLELGDHWERVDHFHLRVSMQTMGSNAWYWIVVMEYTCSRVSCYRILTTSTLYIA